MIVYIGAAIDAVSVPPAEQFQELGNIVVEALGKDVVIFNPFGAFLNANLITDPEDLQFVVETNFASLDASDIAVFIFSDSCSFGVPLEIYHCSSNGKPFVVWYKSTKNPGIYLRHYSKNIVFTKEDLVNKIRELLQDCVKRG